MLQRGVYLAPSQFESLFLSTALTDELIDKILEAHRESMIEIHKKPVDDMSLKVYGIKNCNTMKKTFDFLESKGVEYEVHRLQKAKAIERITHQLY